MRLSPPGRRGISIALAVAIFASACGSATPPSFPTRPPASTAPASTPTAVATNAPAVSDATTFAAIESQVEAIRGLKAVHPVNPVLLDPTGLRDKLTAINTSEIDHVALANESRLLVHMGLLPAGSSLEQLELDLEAGQVVGFYDPTSKGLYVLSDSGGVGPVEKMTFSHEYTHALQDQSFGLDKLAIDAPDQGDRDMARTALAEGDATMAMTLWSGQYLSLAELLSVAGASLTPGAADQLAKAPAILREDLLFPYQQGLDFVQRVYASGGWAAVDRLYANPPDSTSQILHPELYATGVKPVIVSLPSAPRALGSGWKTTMQDTLGEFQLRIWLEGEAPTDAQSTAAAAATSEWGGDRVGLYEGPDGKWAVVLRTQWRSPAGRAAFVAAANRPPLARDPTPHYLVCGDALQADIYLASDDETLSWFAPCQPGT
jgi:hypothetical protein